MSELSQVLLQLMAYLRTACEIGLLAFLIYSALLFIRGTRAAPILAGITILTIALSLLARFLELEVLEWIMMKMWTFLALSVLIIFQPEIKGRACPPELISDGSDS